METLLTVVEAYLPGAVDRDPSYFLRLVGQVRSSIGSHGLEVSLLVLAGDETLLWLVRTATPSGGREWSVADFDIPGAIAAATAPEAGHLIERHVSGRLVEIDS